MLEIRCLRACSAARRTVRWLALSLILGLGLFVDAREAFAAILYVQGNSADPSTSVSSLTVTYSAAQTAGNLNVVAVSWSSTSVSSITDTKGNTYTLAVGPTT